MEQDKLQPQRLPGLESGREWHFRLRSLAQWEAGFEENRTVLGMERGVHVSDTGALRMW